MKTLLDEIGSVVSEEMLAYVHKQLGGGHPKTWEELSETDKTYFRIIANRIINAFIRYNHDIEIKCGSYDPDADKKEKPGYFL